MIYDCFLFNDEVELLELRLMETYDLVDWFVLVEAPINWQLKEKPLYFKENAKHFSKWFPKIRHIVAYDLPQGPFPVTESAQRGRMESGLYDALPEDTIIVSDMDEIMSRRALWHIRKNPPMYPIALEQFLYYYKVNCQQNCIWRGPVAQPRSMVTPLDAHQVIWMRTTGIPSMERGGYHFSWLGDVERIQYKLRCHTVEEDSKHFGGNIKPPNDNDTEHLKRCIETGADLFNRTNDSSLKRFVPIQPGVTHPKCINEWLEKYPEFA